MAATRNIINAESIYKDSCCDVWACNIVPLVTTRVALQLLTTQMAARDFSNNICSVNIAMKTIPFCMGI